MTPEILYLLASESLCDIKTARNWAKGERQRRKMKPMVRLRVDRAAEKLGIEPPPEAPKSA